MRAITRVTAIASLTAVMLIAPGAAHAVEASCSVVGGDAELTLDGTGVSFFNVEFVAGPTGALNVTAIGGGGLSNPCAGYDRSNAATLTILGTANNEVVQLYTDAFPTGLTADVDLDVGVDSFSLLVDQGAGNDKVTSGTAADTISGGTGNDVISSGAGNDVVNGYAGRDRLTGGAGRDRLLGGTGDDTITGGSGADRLDGGAGNDRVLARDRARDTSINCGTGAKDVASVDTVRLDRSVRGCEQAIRP